MRTNVECIQTLSRWPIITKIMGKSVSRNTRSYGYTKNPLTNDLTVFFSASVLLMLSAASSAAQAYRYATSLRVPTSVAHRLSYDQGCHAAIHRNPLTSSL